MTVLRLSKSELFGTLPRAVSACYRRGQSISLMNNTLPLPEGSGRLKSLALVRFFNCWTKKLETHARRMRKGYEGFCLETNETTNWSCQIKVKIYWQQSKRSPRHHKLPSSNPLSVRGRLWTISLMHLWGTRNFH